MSAVVLLLALLALAAVLVVAAVVVVVLPVRRWSPGESASGVQAPGVQASGVPAHEGRRPLLRAAGLVLGVTGALAVGSSGDLGRGVLLAAPVLALGILLGLLGAELVVRPPAGPRRTASLTTRRPGDYLPRRLSAVVVTTGATLTVLGVLTTTLGSPDDLGRAGRFLTVVCSPDQVASRGPWPGSYYTAPLAVVVALGVGLGLLVLRATVARPPLGPDPALGPVPADRAEAADTGLRRRAARSVVAGLGLLLAVPLVGTAAFAGSAVAGLAGCAPGWWAAAGAALLLLAAASVAVVLWCLSVVLLDRWAPVAGPAPAAHR